MHNPISLDTLAAALAHALQVDSPLHSAHANDTLLRFIDEKFGASGADRVVMYNPDAIGEWVYRKYAQLMPYVNNGECIEVPFATVMPSVTPVCFGTMYTGAQPAVHGIQSYVKPVITIDTLFDCVIHCGKKPAIVCTAGDSLSKIFLERDMDYYIYDTMEEVNAKAVELILRDEYDLIVIYNGNYDTAMHKNGPEGIKSLTELRVNDHFFGILDNLIKNNWKHHNTLLGFAMDHGCHEIDGECGSHGLDMDEDINIVHLYKAYTKE